MVGNSGDAVRHDTSYLKANRQTVFILAHLREGKQNKA